MKCIRRDHTFWTTCPCDECTQLRRRRNKLQHCGRFSRVPASVAWERIEQWLKDGYQPAWIASACGVPLTYIQRAVGLLEATGVHQQLGPVRSAQIMAADITAATAGRRDATGTRRRLQALAVGGWSVERLDAECGIKFTTLAAIRRGHTATVGARHWTTIRDLYARLEHTRGPSEGAATRALGLGWAPPAQWDDPDTDAEPGSPRARSMVELVEEFNFIVSCGSSEASACVQLGVTMDWIYVARKRIAGQPREGAA